METKEIILVEGEIKTMEMYKLVEKIGENSYRSLYINSEEIVHCGEWWTAREGELLPNGKVKARKLNALANRPGIHCTMSPWTDWIGQRMPDGTLARRRNYVWLRVLVDVTVNYNPLARERGWLAGKWAACRACLDYVPHYGWYWYKTNSKQVEPWAICGRVWVEKELTEDEVNEICWSKGITPQKLA